MLNFTPILNDKRGSGDTMNHTSELGDDQIKRSTISRPRMSIKDL